jgi:hypothetical protein
MIITALDFAVSTAAVAARAFTSRPIKPRSAKLIANRKRTSFRL